MNPLLRYILLGSLALLLLAGCTDPAGTDGTGATPADSGTENGSPAGSDPVVTADPGGGIGGSGGGGSVSVLTQGVITGFGSVFVDGVEFETNGNIFVGDAEASEADLHLGMVVIVDGLVNENGLTGIANAIHYEAEVTGPIADVPVTDADGETKSFTILGKTVIVEESGTVFEGSDPPFTFDTIAQGDIVEASGFLNADGALVCTYIERKAAPTTEEPVKVELKGTVTGFNGSDSFSLGSITVTFDPAGSDTDLSGVPDGVISDGLDVAVKGELTAADAVFATRIKVETEIVTGGDDGGDDPGGGDPGGGDPGGGDPGGSDPGSGDPDSGEPEAVPKVSIQGFVTAFVSVGDFQVAGQPVDATDAVFAPPSLENAIQAGSKVSVRGPVAAGVLVAELVQSKTENVKVEAPVSAVDAEGGTVTVTIVAGQPGVAFNVNAQTLLLDKVAPPTNPLSLEDLEAGDFLSIVALRDDDGILDALVIFRDHLDDIRVKGKVVAADADARTVSLLGVTIPLADDAEFQDKDNVAITEAAFFEQVQADDKVKIRLEQPDDGLADEVELETEE